MIQIQGITKTFGDVRALDDVSFDVDKGEFIFLTGPSGAGKTTLLKLILREYDPDRGKILIEGKNILKLSANQIPTLRQRIGMVFQDFKVLNERTVFENVAVALAVVGVAQNEWKKRVDQVLGLVGVKGRSDFFPSQLSGGELQRVSLARALVVNPKVLLADEPTGNLDWETADMLIDLFEKINKEGKTIIMATHHEGVVDKYGKRVVKLRRGKLERDDNKKKSSKTTKKSSQKK